MSKLNSNLAVIATGAWKLNKDIQGGLTPAEDNLVHTSLKDLLKFAKAPNNQVRLATIIKRMEKEGFKDPTPLLRPENKDAMANTPPPIIQNPFGTQPIAQEEKTEGTPDAVEIVNTARFLQATLGGYCDAATIKGALQEMKSLGWEIV